MAERQPYNRRQPYVIMLDDDVAVAEMYRLGLELQGFRVSVTVQARELFDKIATEVPDIFILDWQLPGTNGGEVIEALRRDWRTAAVPVFMLSNFNADLNGAVDRVFQAGAVAWLTKADTPPDTLAQRLREGLKR